jgi:hypothetical protein
MEAFHPSIAKLPSGREIYIYQNLQSMKNRGLKNSICSLLSDSRYQNYLNNKPYKKWSQQHFHAGSI